MPRIYTRVPVAQRFWAKVEKGDGCWLWTGCRQSSGYGRVASGDPSKPTVEGAHRIAYELQCGPIPPGMSVLHHCDTPACCRGSHLFLGTAKDNCDDMHAKGRNVPPVVLYGEDALSAVLSKDQVRSILASKDTHKALALRFGVAPSTVKAVRDGITWGYVGDSRKPFGRRRTGEDHRGAKLTENDVIAIRKSRLSSSELARQYGIDGATLSAARWGKTWKHLPPSEHDRAVIEQIGENHHNARLTVEAVRTIRAFSGPARIIAAQLGVSASSINLVRRREIWKHVE